MIHQSAIEAFSLWPHWNSTDRKQKSTSLYQLPSLTLCPLYSFSCIKQANSFIVHLTVTLRKLHAAPDPTIHSTCYCRNESSISGRLIQIRSTRCFETLLFDQHYYYYYYYYYCTRSHNNNSYHNYHLKFLEYCWYYYCYYYFFDDNNSREYLWPTRHDHRSAPHNDRINCGSQQRVWISYYVVKQHNFYYDYTK
mmetsp:Transcript_26338/g.72721  ORF Transcript_26338/g.72721 Transcript_26338/m.72721 type:complete len:195 (+) Transcript_26338:1836-2420(+)